MEYSIERGAQRQFLLAVSLIVAAILIFFAIRIWLAYERVDSPSLPLMRRGAALDPGNGEAWDRIGRYLQWDFANPDPLAAIANYKRAIEDDPRSAHFWMDLASAYEDAGDTSKAQDAYEHAKAAYPASAEVAFNYGNFLIRAGRNREGYGEIQQAVRTDPRLLPLAISRTWRTSGSAEDVLKNVLPPTTEGLLQGLDFFVSISRSDDALGIWQRLVDLGKPLTLSRSFPLLDELIREDRSDDALRVWREAISAVPGEVARPNAPPADRSIVWNGDFGSAFANGGLDWRWNSPLGASIDFDSSSPPAGKRSVRMEFNGGSNLSLDEPMEYAPVESGRVYRFHAFLRTDQISTESGIRFLIADPNHPDVTPVLTENLTGSHGWTPVDAEITAGPRTHFLLVRLLRTPSRLFDNKLSGVVWMAGVSVIPADAPQDIPPVNPSNEKVPAL